MGSGAVQHYELRRRSRTYRSRVGDGAVAPEEQRSAREIFPVAVWRYEMSEAVLAKHEALLIRLMRIESAEEFYDEVDTAAGTWLEDLGLRDAIQS
jgi:hypothetical protein